MKIFQEKAQTVATVETQNRSEKAERTQKKSEKVADPTTAGKENDGVLLDISQGRSRVVRILQQESTWMDAVGGADSAAVGTMDGTVRETGQEEAPQEKESEEETNGHGYSTKDVEYMERMLKQLQESRTSNRKTSTKKKLNYSYRKVSSAIMRAKTGMQASSALSAAKSQLADLKRKAGTGQYEDAELEIAIAHANKMIRTARKKAANLKVEQTQEKSDKDTLHSQERKNKVIQQQQEAPQKVEVQADLEQQMIQLKKKLKQLTDLEKNGHRRTENFELLEADMEYLKKKIDLMRQDQSSQNTTSVPIGTDVTAQTGTASVSVGTETKTATAAEVVQSGMEQQAAAEVSAE